MNNFQEEKNNNININQKNENLVIKKFHIYCCLK